jgi:hypothetical protein
MVIIAKIREDITKKDLAGTRSSAKMFQCVPRMPMLFFERRPVLLVFIELLFQPLHLLFEALGPQLRVLEAGYCLIVRCAFSVCQA